MKNKHISYWSYVLRDKEGNVLEEGVRVPNMLHDEGEQYILQAAFSGEATPPADFYIGLISDTPVEGDGLADLLGEPSTNGYARQTVPSTAVGWAIGLDAGDYQAQSQTVQFSATGGSWGPVDHMMLATTVDNTGLLIASVALSTARELQDGDTLDVDIAIKLSE